MTVRIKHPGRRLRAFVVLSSLAIGSGDVFAFVAMARTDVSQAPAPAQAAASPIPAQQLDSLVAPIALYPDPLLAQVLAASTYPLELMQLQQWLSKNPTLKGKALSDAVMKQPWDPSVQAMAGLPDVVKWLTGDIQWTTDLGNAFLAQQSDVMSAVQRMRQKAEDRGTLKTTEQQVVQTKLEDNHEVIVIEQADPQVIYVPSYNPVTVWGDPYYPYPPIYYPPAGYYAGRAIAFGTGVAMGAFWGSGGWGWRPGWGDWDIDVDWNNNFNRNWDRNVNRDVNRNINRNTNIRNNTWQHNPAHRGGTPYRDRATANRFGGTTRGDSLAHRQSSARQQINRQGGQTGSRERGAVGTGGITSRPGGSGINRPSTLPGGSRPGSGNFNRPTTIPSRGSADRVGSRDFSSSSRSGSFGSGSRGFDGGHARASHSRGSSSFSSRSGGGGRSFSGGGGRSRGGGGSRGGGRR